MKILHVITSLQTGGAERLMVDLLPQIKEKGVDVELCVFYGIDTPFKSELEHNGIRVISLGQKANIYHPMYFWRLFRLLKHNKYDVVHTHNTAPQIFVALISMLCSVVLVTTEHTTSNRRRGWRWYAPVDRWMYNRYKEVICISEKAEENLRAHIGHCKAHICTINNGVDICKFSEASSSPDMEAIAPQSKKLIMVAGFRWEKDQDTIIRALSLLPIDFHLFLVGDGVRRKVCEDLAQRSGVADRVHFMGLRTDVPQLLHAVNYIIMSSHFEGLSLSSIEGMSVGKPFLASDVDGLREVVSGAGLLFPHSDEQSLADLISSLENDTDRYHSVAEACRKRAAQYDISQMLEGYEHVYQQLFKKESDK